MAYATFAECGKTLGISSTKCRELIREVFHDLNRTSILTRTKSKVKQKKLVNFPRRNLKLTEEMRDYLTAPDTVMQWAGLTLAQRAVMFHRKFTEVHITPTTVRNVYKKAGIKYKVVAVKKFANLRKQSIIRAQTKRGKEQLEEAQESGVPVYWLDECIFSTKTW